MDKWCHVPYNIHVHMYLAFMYMWKNLKVETHIHIHMYMYNCIVHTCVHVVHTCTYTYIVHPPCPTLGLHNSRAMCRSVLVGVEGRGGGYEDDLPQLEAECSCAELCECLPTSDSVSSCMCTSPTSRFHSRCISVYGETKLALETLTLTPHLNCSVEV